MLLGYKKHKCPVAEAIFQHNLKKGNFPTDVIQEHTLKKLKLDRNCNNAVGMTRLYTRELSTSKTNPEKKHQKVVPVGWLCEVCQFIKLDAVKND